ncbi:MAG: hypothetical protein LBV74_22520 [Tannerella sp.]|jgi:hypothetical protein|nr:hypothetical protein [Tannerella sp.]
MEKIRKYFTVLIRKAPLPELSRFDAEKKLQACSIAKWEYFYASFF